MLMLKMNDCIFCNVLVEEVPSSKVYQDELVALFMDIQPVNQGHMLVIPNVHAPYLADLDPDRKLDYSNATLGHHHTSPPQDPDTTVWGLDENTVQGYRRGIWEYAGHQNEKIIFSCPDGQVAPLLYLTGSQGGVDWDCDGTPAERGRIQANINNLPTAPNSDFVRLEGHNDWSVLHYNFSDNLGNYAEGRHSRVASGVTLTGGDGIPFGETNQTLAAKGLKPDTNYNYFPTNSSEVTIEISTLHRISNLLALYRQVAMFDESDFSSAYSQDSKSYEFSESGKTTSIQDPGIGHETHQLAIILPPSEKIYTGHLTYSASEPVQLVALNGPLAEGEDMGQPIWTPDGETKFALTLVDPEASEGEWTFSGNALAVHTMNPELFTVTYEVAYTESILDGDLAMSKTLELPLQSGLEPKKDSFKKAIKDAIDQINLRDIQKTQKTVKSIDAALQKSLPKTHYTEKIHPLTSNLLGTYEKALGFGMVSPLQEIEDEIEEEPIIEIEKIADMIKNVEEFVSEVKSFEGILQCNPPFQLSNQQCVCPAGNAENKEGDCVVKLLSPREQEKSGIAAEDVECKVGFKLLLKATTKTAACISPSTAVKLISVGWGTSLE